MGGGIRTKGNGGKVLDVDAQERPITIHNIRAWLGSFWLKNFLTSTRWGGGRKRESLYGKERGEGKVKNLI